jgi:hypothetical protein
MKFALQVREHKKIYHTQQAIERAKDEGQRRDERKREKEHERRSSKSMRMAKQAASIGNANDAAILHTQVFLSRSPHTFTYTLTTQHPSLISSHLISYIIFIFRFTSFIHSFIYTYIHSSISSTHSLILIK